MSFHPALQLVSDPSARGHATVSEGGFTLVEAVIVLIITGIIAAMVAVFLQKPVQGYFDSTRRAELSDEADTALRRITRDLRLALPNSVRVSAPGGVSHLEFLLTKGGGRYRAEKTGANTGNVLDFVSGSSNFDVIGPMPSVAANDQIVVFNLGPGFGTADAYQPAPNNNRPAVQSVAAPTITLTAPKIFPNESPGKRFQVVESTVSYVCTPSPAGGSVTRYWGYSIVAGQPTLSNGGLPAGSQAVLAKNVTNCTFTYDPNAVALRNGVVSISITLSKSGESVSLFQEAHVSNVP